MKKILDFIDREHIKILVALIIMLLALIAFIELSTINNTTLSSLIGQIIKNLFS